LAQENGVQGITLGCGSGNCGICEVEVKKFSNGDKDEDAQGIVVRSCITPLPSGGYTYIEVSEMVDSVWGQDGFDM